jgi:hypothetical protein
MSVCRGVAQLCCSHLLFRSYVYDFWFTLLSWNNRLMFLLQFHVCSWCIASSCCVQPTSPACHMSLTSLLHCYLLEYYCNYNGALLGRTHLTNIVYIVHSVLKGLIILYVHNQMLLTLHRYLLLSYLLYFRRISNSMFWSVMYCSFMMCFCLLALYIWNLSRTSNYFPFCTTFKTSNVFFNCAVFMFILQHMQCIFAFVFMSYITNMLFISCLETPSCLAHV